MILEPSTREKIISAVLHLFGEGKHDLSMSDIAQEVGVSKAALYYFFKDKKELLTEVVVSMFQEMLYAAEFIAEKQISPEKKMEELMLMILTSARKQRSTTHFVFQQVFEHDPLLLQKIFMLRGKMEEVFARIFAEGVVAKKFRADKEIVAPKILLGFLDFLIMASSFPCPEEGKCSMETSPEKLCSELLELFSLAS